MIGYVCRSLHIQTRIGLPKKIKKLSECDDETADVDLNHLICQGVSNFISCCCSYDTL